MSARVSVVTPFYNAAAYLEECIRSVLGQTMQDFEYLLVNNCSTDDSLQIALRFAALDRRIQVIENPRFLSQVDNYNGALARISPTSEYCKIVQADDWLFKRCLEEMVELAASSPDIGIVSSYRLCGQRVNGLGLPLAARISSGRSICRIQLLGDCFFFGSPTTILYRSAIVRSRMPFFAKDRLHEDTEACYEILGTCDFGFVHQVLSFTRVDNESIMSSVRRFSPEVLDKLIVLKKFGAAYLDPAELAARWRSYESFYLDFLAEAVISLRSSEFWRYQRRGWASVDYSPSTARLIGHVALKLLDLLLNPKNTITRLASAMKAKATSRSAR